VGTLEDSLSPHAPPAPPAPPHQSNRPAPPPQALRPAAPAAVTVVRAATKPKAAGRSTATGALLAAVAVALLAVVLRAVGARFVLAFFGVVDLPDSYPVCVPGEHFVWQCECGPGMEADDPSWYSILVARDHCTTCDAHEFKAGRGNFLCSQCPAAQRGTKDRTSCKACPLGSTRAHPTRTGVVGASCEPCPPNSFLRGDRCEVCGPDSEAPGGGVAVCTPCPPGHVRAAGLGPGGCAACDVNAFADPLASPGLCLPCSGLAFTPGPASVGRASCKCLQGATRNDPAGECQPCPANSYKNTTGNGACTPCRPNHLPTPDRSREVLDTTYDGFLARTPGRTPGIGSRMLFMLDRASSAVSITNAAKTISSAFKTLLEEFIKFLWGSDAAFQADFERSGGAADHSRFAQAEAEDNGRTFSRSAGADCPFRDAAAFTRFAKGTSEYAAIASAVRAGDSGTKKRAAKEMLKVYHVDKFKTRYKACDPDMALDLTRELQGIFARRKASGFDETWDNMQS